MNDEQSLVASPSKASQSSEAPIRGREEDARIDVGLKRSLDEPTFDRTSQRSKIFGLWRADDHTEWGDKKQRPVIANCRDLKLFHRLETADMYYALLEPESSLSYLTKQSGKELNEKKIPAHERKLFDKAKILEITNLVNSNAIQIVVDPAELEEIRKILLGHKDPDALQQERFAPTPSSTTVMLCLQIIASMKFELYIMDVSSAFGQSDPHEREQGPLFAAMPPTGIPGYEQNCLIRVATAVYGLVNAPAVWRKTVRRRLIELGYAESVFDPCLFYLRPDADEIANGPELQVAGIVLLDVDDFCQGGGQRHQDLMPQLRTRLKFGKWKNVYKSSAEYIGRTLTQLEDYEIQVSMKRYIQEKLKAVTLDKSRLKDKSSLLSEQEISWLRGVGGSLLWVGKEGRPDVAAACVMSMSWSAGGPTVEHILAANKTVNELKQTPDVVLRIVPIDPACGIWMSIADASMANVDLSPKEVSSWPWLTEAFSINSWKRHRLKRVVKATLGSEAWAMDDALAEIEWLRALWHEVMDPASTVMDGSKLGNEDSILVVRLPEEEAEDVRSIRINDRATGAHVTDAKALFDLLARRSGNAGHDRRAQIDVAVTHVSADAVSVKTFWVPGSQMLADPLTKRFGQFSPSSKGDGRSNLCLGAAGNVMALETPPEGCRTACIVAQHHHRSYRAPSAQNLRQGP